MAAPGHAINRSQCAQGRVLSFAALIQVSARAGLLTVREGQARYGNEPHLPDTLANPDEVPQIR